MEKTTAMMTRPFRFNRPYNDSLKLNFEESFSYSIEVQILPGDTCIISALSLFFPRSIHASDKTNIRIDLEGGVRKWPVNYWNRLTLNFWNSRIWRLFARIYVIAVTLFDNVIKTNKTSIFRCEVIRTWHVLLWFVYVWNEDIHVSFPPTLVDT